MLEGLTMDEYVHWQAIYQTEPFPEERADRRAAQQMINLRRAMGDRGNFTIADFVPDFWGEHQPQQQTPQQIKANMQIVKAAMKKKKKSK